MGSGLAKMLAGQADERTVSEAFTRADTNKNGSLDERETAAVLAAALEMLSRIAPPDTPLPSARGAGLTLGEWRASGTALKAAVSQELSAALFAALDGDGSRTISRAEWAAFDWMQLLPEIQQHIEKAQRAAAPPPVITVPVAAKAAPAAPIVVRRLDVAGQQLRKLPELPETLTELRAEKNAIEELPVRFPTGLVRLRLDDNRLSAPPSHLEELPELGLLWLAGNPELPERWRRNVPPEADQLDRTGVASFLAEMRREDERELGSGSSGDELESGDEEEREMRHDGAGQDLGLLGLLMTEEHRQSLTPKVARK